MKVFASFFALLGALGGCSADDPLPMGSRSEDCAPCHADPHEGWSSSRHAASAQSPVFVAMLPHVERAWGPVARERCVGCHSPGHGGDRSIGCVSCHAAVGNRGEANGALEVDLDAPLAGPSFSPAPTPAHRTTRRGLLSSASLCGTCHEVHGPGVFEEPTLSEFRSTPLAASDSCLPCHRGTPSADDPGAGHRFAGVDPAWGASTEQAERVALEARALWARALKLEVQLGEVASVRLTNEGAGHAVPTGAAFVRDVWVDVEVIDARGARFEVPRALELGSRLLRDGEPVALPTEATHLEPRGLAHGESREVPIAPPGSTAPLQLKATLKAQAVRAPLLSALGLERLAGQVPVLVVAVAP